MAVLNELAFQLSKVSNYVDHTLHTFNSINHIPQTETTLALTMSVPYDIISLSQKISSINSRKFFKDISTDELNVLKSLIMGSKRFLQKYDHRQQLPIFLSSNKTTYLSQLIGTPLKREATFKIHARSIYSPVLYGNLLLAPQSQSDFPITLYKIKPLLINTKQIITEQTLVVLSSKNAFTMSETPEGISDIFTANRNELCADFILHNTGENVCPTKTVQDPFITIEHCQTWPPVLVLSSPTDRLVSLKCPDSEPTTVHVAAGNVHFNKGHVCSVFAEDGSPLYVPPFKGTEVNQAPAKPTTEANPETDFIQNLFTIFRQENLTYVFLILIASCGVIFCLFVTCLMYYCCYKISCPSSPCTTCLPSCGVPWRRGHMSYSPENTTELAYMPGHPAVSPEQNQAPMSQILHVWATEDAANPKPPATLARKKRKGKRKQFPGLPIGQA